MKRSKFFFLCLMLAKGLQKDTEQANSHIFCDREADKLQARYTNRKKYRHRLFPQSCTDVKFIYHNLRIVIK